MSKSEMEYFKPYQDYYQLLTKISIPDVSHVNKMLSSYQNTVRDFFDSTKEVSRYEDYKLTINNITKLSSKIERTMSSAASTLNKTIVSVTNLDKQLKELKIKNIELDTTRRSYEQAVHTLTKTSKYIDETVTIKKQLRTVSVLNPEYLENEKKVNALKYRCDEIQRECEILNAKVSEEIAKIKSYNDLFEKISSIQKESSVTLEVPTPTGYVIDTQTLEVAGRKKEITYYIGSPTFSSDVDVSKLQLGRVIYFGGNNTSNVLGEDNGFYHFVQSEIEQGNYPNYYTVFCNVNIQNASNNNGKDALAKVAIDGPDGLLDKLDEQLGQSNHNLLMGISDGGKTAGAIAGYDALKASSDPNYTPRIESVQLYDCLLNGKDSSLCKYTKELFESDKKVDFYINSSDASFPTKRFSSLYDKLPHETTNSNVTFYLFGEGYSSYPEKYADFGCQYVVDTTKSWNHGRAMVGPIQPIISSSLDSWGKTVLDTNLANKEVRTWATK